MNYGYRGRRTGPQYDLTETPASPAPAPAPPQPGQIGAPQPVDTREMVRSPMNRNWGGHEDERGAQRDVGRYRGMAKPTTAAPVIDQSRSDETRGYQDRAIGYLGRAATGEESMARRLGMERTGEALNAGRSVASSVRGGPIARAAAMRVANRNAGAVEAQGRLATEAAVAAEMAAARGGYANALGQQRQQDIGVATSQAGLDIGRRSADDQREGFYEGLAWDTNKAQMDAELNKSAQDIAAEGSARQASLAADRNSREAASTAAGLAFGGAMGGYQGLTSLAGSRGPSPAPSGGVRYGYWDDGSITSDDKAKLAKAWDEGRAAGIADVQKVGGYRPEQLKGRDDDAAKAARELKAGAWDEGNTTARMDANRKKIEGQWDPQQSAEMDARIAAAREQTASPPVAPAVAQSGYVSQLLARARAMVPSDERAKESKGYVPGSMASAMRSMRPSVYEYKPEYAGRAGQDVGEKNVGPMANNMERDPVASVAVERQPDGMLALDKDKSLKLVMGGLSDLQMQVDQLKKPKRGAA